METIAETKICKYCSIPFDITNNDLEFYQKVSPTFFLPPNKGDGGGLKRFLIPTPNFCPDCRQRRRLSFRNERKLYHRKCDLTGKQIISIYSPDKPYKVYDKTEWWSDKWDALDYGREFDFSKTFFEQFQALTKEVPKVALLSVGSENSDYVNCSGYSKDSYMSFDIGWCEDMLYSRTAYKSQKCMDCSYVTDSSFLYECFNCSHSYNSIFCIDSKSISNCLFCYDLESCSNCLFCFNLRNKEYYIHNKPYSKEEYHKELAKINVANTSAFNTLKNYFFENKLKAIHIFANNKSCEECTGNDLTNCNKCTDSYGATQAEDSRFLLDSFGVDNCYDDCFSGGEKQKAILSLDLIGNFEPYKCVFTFSCWACREIFYGDFCHNCTNCFGCAGLKNQQYCILNKQYKKEEYEEVVPKIIEHMMKTGEWGEYFPSSISPFGYNETLAYEYFPLSKEKIADSGFNRSEYEKQNGYDGEFYKPKETKDYDENIVGKDQANKNTEELLKGILQCEITKKPYKIIRHELEFMGFHLTPPT